ncbi:MAG: hypothetical protein OIF50_13780 [Flavobacteriaceae bacterium]|nr:hypothetical protein [Flavobacteriaceae bacterium]
MKHSIYTLLVFLIFSCGKEEILKEEDPAFGGAALIQIQFPSNTGGYTQEALDVVYDEHTGEIGQISDNDFIWNIISRTESKIIWNGEVKQSDSTRKEGIAYLEENRVSYIIDTEITNDREETMVQTDSIRFLYVTGYISRIEFYRKTSLTMPFALHKTVDYLVHHGNISQAISRTVSETKTSLFAYDRNSFILYTDFNYEMPINPNYWYFLLYANLGMKNANNIVGVSNVFESNNSLEKQYSFIHYHHQQDEQGRLKEVFLSGATVLSDTMSNQYSFRNKKGAFVYE